ncbi:MAG: alpha/beta hydrolase [Phormidesmis sp.]
MATTFMALPSTAAERVVVKIGPLQQSVELSDLESFANTGEVPDSLRLYQRFLTPQVRQSLQQTLSLDPKMSDRIIEDVLNSENGDLLLNSLSQIAPNLTLQQLQGAIRLAASQGDGLSMLGILQAIPQDTIEVDMSAAIALASQLNLSNLESRSLSGVLEQELHVSPSQIPHEYRQSEIDPTATGTADYAYRTFSFRDEARDRIIPINVHWSRQSRQDTERPLVVLSHGFGADRYFLNYLAEHLASNGLTVVSIEHPGSNVQALVNLPLDPDVVNSPSKLLPAQEFLDRPRDVSFVLDRLAEINEGRSAYRDAFNTENVTMIGHSLGGYTGLALAGAKLDLRSLQAFCGDIQPLGVSPADWLQCAAMELDEQQADLSDERIQQVMAMNTLTGQLFGEAGLSDVSIPTLLLTGTQDGVTPTLDHQLAPFEQLAGEKYLLAVIGGTHLVTGDPENVNPSLTELPFMSELRAEETTRLRQLLQGVSLSFIHQQTSEAPQYKPFLSAAYVQSFSTPTLPLRFAQTLPGSVRNWLSITSRLSAVTKPSTTGRLFALSYLKTIESRPQMQKAVAVHLRANQVMTLLRW